MNQFFQAIVKSIAPKKAKKSKSPSKDLVDGMEKAKLVIDNLHVSHENDSSD